MILRWSNMSSPLGSQHLKVQIMIATHLANVELLRTARGTVYLQSVVSGFKLLMNNHKEVSI